MQVKQFFLKGRVFLQIELETQNWMTRSQIARLWSTSTEKDTSDWENTSSEKEVVEGEVTYMAKNKMSKWREMYVKTGYRRCFGTCSRFTEVFLRSTHWLLIFPSNVSDTG